ncbi:glycosyl hydrolase family 63 [Mucilaginibacter gracilis]|uniref:mannosyl-oligosaccharide glucosidase n=1 Tax=Mucilaginibacter gracilis TaxID=423350 RepID=A0A495J8C1_9SPHI|nr:glucosidase [Mucilaginibacter gracilis]RKR85001.1 glycosyl hydrolase family 63 [Mucilaginibacter gracilis]
MANTAKNAEQTRLEENALKAVPLEHWGPYVSERQWATVREDYSNNGDAWGHFTHDQARSRAYRWGEDGLAGISDYFQRLCFAVALWNGKDPILKERLFGLPNGQGNHGEDVKELYYYLDNVPSHYYMKYLYKYPQTGYPYDELVSVNMHRSKQEPEYEILDTNVFDNDRYFDVFITYAKQNAEDIQICIEIINRGQLSADITVLPTLWFFNYWQTDKAKPKPSITRLDDNSVKASHYIIGDYYFYFQDCDKSLFTENETNKARIYRQPNESVFVKDAFHEAIIDGDNIDELAAKNIGTKFAPVYKYTIRPQQSKKIFMRLSKEPVENAIGHDFEALFNLRKQEADDFYSNLLPANATPEFANIQRQAFAGLLWNKQYYHYDTREWHRTSKSSDPSLLTRPNGRNGNWKYLNNQDVISMPDKWEYPWYAAWDLAFHCVPMAMIDPEFAKNQLILIMREWYMNPEGQVPAYEWNFSDVNPPIQAWAALQVYRIEKEKKGVGDLRFLKRVFQKLIINFTWWANRKDVNGNNIFAGGFLGLDNIGVFDRSSPIKDAVLDQVDGTSWMGTFALNMMDIALEISVHDDAFEDMALKFYEHFVLIAEALNELGLWNDEDAFFYDTLRMHNGTYHLKVRSLVGLTSMFAVSVVDYDRLALLKDFSKRAAWLNKYRSQHKLFLPIHDDGKSKILLSLVPFERLEKLLERLCDESEFLAKGGVRALSKFHEANPYTANIDGRDYSIKYEPGDSTTNLFGGNSNWRGPIWMPMNFILINSLKKYYEFYGDEKQFNFPTDDGIKKLTLGQIANELSRRLISTFEADETGARPLHSKAHQAFYKKPENADLILYYEYFHGDDSNGLGASHQTGWSALIANLINDVEV